MKRKRGNYGDWVNLLKNGPTDVDEQETQTAIPPIGSLPHPSELTKRDILYPPEDE